MRSMLTSDHQNCSMALQMVNTNSYQFTQPPPQQLQQLPQQHQQQQQQPIRPVIERGASWSYNETRILLSLWGQDMVQRQLTNSKRTRHVWEKIADRIRDHGFERTPDQVRTRVFNMIAEYRRILKNPTPERKKKCIFFDALHKIYQAKDLNGVKAALNSYEEDYNLEPIEFLITDENDAENGDADYTNGDGEDRSEVFAYAMSPSQTLNGVNGHGSGDESIDETNHCDVTDVGPSPMKRVRTDSNTTLNQFGYQNSFDNSSPASALLIDRMFSHLAKETEVMREWVNLERERLSQEITRRKEESEREERREKCFLQTLMKMQEQMFTFLAKQPKNPPNGCYSPLSPEQHPEDLGAETTVSFTQSAE